MKPESLRRRLTGGQNGTGERKVMVAGTFRSGTNLTHHCLKTHFEAEPVYNEWFWKHGVPPTCLQRPLPPEVPVVVMSKDPIDLNASLYRFWQARRPELEIGASLSEFVRRRFVVYDNSRSNIDPKYYYLTPTEYWNQFYFSWLNWDEVAPRRMFLRVEDMMADAEAALAPIAERFGLVRRGFDPVSLPEQRIGPTPSDEIRARDYTFSDADREFIRAAVDPQIAQALGYVDYL